MVLPRKPIVLYEPAVDLVGSNTSKGELALKESLISNAIKLENIE